MSKKRHTHNAAPTHKTVPILEGGSQVASLFAKEWMKVSLAALVLMLSIVAAMFPLFFGSAIYETDTLYYYLPAFKFYSDALHAGTSFAIAPIFSGFPLLLTQVGGFLDPLNLLIFKVFSFPLAYQLRVALNYFLAGIFAFLFARSLRLNFVASVVAMFGYVTAQHMIPGSNILRSNSFFLMPGLFYCLQQLSMTVGTRRWRSALLYGLLGIAVLIVSFLGGYTQLVLYSLIASGLFALYLLYQTFSYRLLAAFAGLSVIAGAAVFPYVHAVLALVEVSHRAGGLSWTEASRGITAIDYLYTLTTDLVLPPQGTGTLQSLYIGSVSILFCGYALFLVSKRNTHIIFFLGLFLFSVLCAFPYPLFFIMHALPVFSFFRFPPHWFAVSSFALSMLAALGTHYFLSAELQHSYASIQRFLRHRAGIAAFSLVLAINFIVPARMEIAAGNVSFTELMSAPWVLRTIDESIPASEDRVFRTYQLYSDGTWAIFANLLKPDVEESILFEHEFTQTHLLPLLWDTDTVLGFDNLEPLRYREVMDFLERPTYKEAIESEGVLPAESIVNIPSYNFMVLGMMNVRYFWSLSSLSKQNEQDAKLVDTGYTGNDVIAAHLYKNNHFLPRVFSTKSVQVIPEGGHAFETIIATPHSFAETTFIECSECTQGVFTQEPLYGADMHISNDAVSFASRNQAQTWVVISNSNVPGWKATIDGKETKIYYANYLYQGILIPAGTHTVRIQYKPPYSSIFHI